MDALHIYNETTKNDSDFLNEFSVFNGSDSVSTLAMERTRKNMLGYLQLVLAALAIISNLFIVCIILSSKLLRNSSKHILILNLSFVDLIKTSAILLYAYMNFEESPVYECDLEYISKLITDLTTGLSGVFIFLLNIDYLVTTNNSPCYPGRRFCGPVVLSFLNYVITGSVLVPLFVFHLKPNNLIGANGQHTCWPFIKDVSFLIYELLPVLPQTFLILVSGGMTIGGYISRANLLNISKELDLVRRPIDLNLAGFLTLTLHFLPYAFSMISKLVFSCEICYAFSAAYFVFPMLPFIKCVLLPFIWLHCPDVRSALKICSRPKPTRETIKDIEEQQADEKKEEITVQC